MAAYDHSKTVYRDPGLGSVHDRIGAPDLAVENAEHFDHLTNPYGAVDAGLPPTSAMPSQSGLPAGSKGFMAETKKVEKPKLRMPPGGVNVTKQRLGIIIGLSGADVVRHRIAATKEENIANSDEPPRGASSTVNH